MSHSIWASFFLNQKLWIMTIKVSSTKEQVVCICIQVNVCPVSKDSKAGEKCFGNGSGPLFCHNPMLRNIGADLLII